jgi:hypothetical protein
LSGISKRVAKKVVVMAAIIAKGLRHLLQRTLVSRLRNRKVPKMARERGVTSGRSHDNW